MENKKILKLIFITTTVAGCSWIPSVGPDYERPTDPKVAEWIVDESGKNLFSTALDSRAQWWKSFEDPVLSELIDKGIKENLTLGIAKDRLLQAKAAQLGSIGGFLPSIFGTYAFDRSQNSARTPLGTFISEIFDNNQIGLDASWEIDIFGGTRRRYESADAAFESAVASADDVGVSVAAEIAATYVEYRTLERRYQLAIDNSKSQQESKDLVQAKFDAGVVSDLDLQQAIALLESTKATIPTLSGQKDAALYRLAVLVGEVPQTFKVNPDQRQNKNLIWDKVLNVTQPTEFLRVRPDVRSAERQLASATADIGVSMAEIFPSISLVGGLGLQSVESSQLMERASRYWRFGPQVSTPIFQGGTLIANIKGSRRRADEILKQYELTVLSALEDAQNSLNSYKNSLDRINNLKAAVSASQRALEISQELYKQGLADFQRVLESQRSLFSSQDQLALGEQQTYGSAISVYRAFAGGLPLNNHEENNN
jgi:multidrug efflux system outer membrane protein